MAKKPDIEKNNVKLDRLVVVTVPIDSIRPNEYNPNRQGDHEFELLCRSMREDGFTQPVIVHRDTNEIVDGEHRWRAAQALGMKVLPIVYVDMSREQMKIATLRHNRARGSEDIDRAAEVLRQLEGLGAIDYAQNSLMLDDVEIERMLADAVNTEVTSGLSAELDAQMDAAGAAEDAAGNVDYAQAQVQGATHAAVEAQRKREKLLMKARTEEARARVLSETQSMHRLMLLFQGDEGELVRSTLGVKPAEKLVEVLTWYESA